MSTLFGARRFDASLIAIMSCHARADYRQASSETNVMSADATRAARFFPNSITFFARRALWAQTGNCLKVFVHCVFAVA
jgi:hypothetical protein